MFTVENSRGEELQIALQEEVWDLYTDGSLIDKGVGVECILGTPGEPLTHGLVLSYPATNNEAEYEALIVEIYVEVANRASPVLSGRAGKAR